MSRARLHLRRWQWGILAAFAVMFALAGAGTPNERDSYWAARAGWENLTGTPLVRMDTWSWSASGPWFPNSPAWNMVLGAAWHWGGYPGIFAITLMSILAYLTLAWWVALRLGARPLPGLIGMAACLLIAGSLVSARATLPVASLLLASFLFSASWGRAAGRRPEWQVVVVPAAVGFCISTLGNWLHLSYLMFAAVTAVLWMVVWLLIPEVGWPLRASMVMTGSIGLFLGCLFSPYGIGLTVARARAVQTACEGIITEWSSAFAIGKPQWLAAVGFALVASMGAARWVWREYLGRRGSARLPLMIQCVAVALPAAIAALGSLRFLGVSLFAVTPLVAAAMTGATRRVQDAPALRRALGSPRLETYTSGPFWFAVLAVAGTVLAPIALLQASQLAVPPEASLADALPRNCRLVSSPDVAGPLLLERPDVTVWIDGRADFYGRDRLLETQRMLSGKTPIPPGATCAVFEDPVRSEWINAPQAALDADPTWFRVADRNGFMLWVRR